MATLITTIKFTEQGIKNVNETCKRALKSKLKSAVGSMRFAFCASETCGVVVSLTFADQWST